MKQARLKSKILKVSTLAFISVLLATPPSNADALPDEQFSIITSNNFQSGQELQGLLIEDNYAYSNMVSYLNSVEDPSNYAKSTHDCVNDSNNSCSINLLRKYVAILPPCSMTITIDCIDGISATDSKGKATQGVLVRNMPIQGFTDFPGDSSNNLPTGSTPSLWSIPGVVNGGSTTQYLINFRTEGYAKPGESRFSLSDYSANIFPVSLSATGSYTLPKHLDSTSGFDQINGPQGPLADYCAGFEQQDCALKQAFPSNYTFKLSARLSQSPTGWFQGRLQTPNVELTQAAQGYSLQISALPVKVPVVGVLQKYSSLAPELQTFYANKSQEYWGNAGPNGRLNGLSTPPPNSDDAFSQFAMWSGYINDKASATPTEWNFSTLQTNGQTNECLSDSKNFIGIVTTNSMMFAGGPPSFDSTSGTLNYHVGSPHYSSNGDVFKGTYDLQMNSTVAKCLYGFSNAPIRATVSITDSSGNNDVATTVVGQSNGWLKMAAYGFTFSDPTIHVKMTQESAPQGLSPSKTSSSPVSTTTGNHSALVQQTSKTISCQKGTLRKKFTTKQCPTGFKLTK